MTPSHLVVLCWPRPGENERPVALSGEKRPGHSNDLGLRTPATDSDEIG
jgi:hypothetical protein